MVAIKTHFNGKNIVLPEELKNSPPGEVIVVFPTNVDADGDKLAWLKAQEAAFARVWDNEEDAIYDEL